MASVAGDAAGVADALGVESFAVMGHSGGGPHALACAALLPEAGGERGLHFRAGGPPGWRPRLVRGHGRGGQAELRAADASRDVLEAHLTSTDFDPTKFTAADHAALAGDWSSVGENAGRGLAAGIDGMVDDDMAHVRPWDFDLGQVRAPVLLVHGDADRVVPPWLAGACRSAEVWLRPDDGHISVLDCATDALNWLAMA